MEHIRGVVKNVIAQLVDERQQLQATIGTVWREVLGPKASVHTEIAGVEKKVLRVYVDSSAWLFQLHLKKGQLLKKLNEATGAIEDIHFRIGRVHEEGKETKRDQRKKTGAPR